MFNIRVHSTIMAQLQDQLTETLVVLGEPPSLLTHHHIVGRGEGLSSMLLRGVLMSRGFRGENKWRGRGSVNIVIKIKVR